MSVIRKMLNKYKNLSLVAKVSLWYAFSNFMQKFIVVLSVPIITRMISASDYGMYSVYGSWFEIAYNFCTLALASGGYYVGMKKYSERKKEYDSIVISLCFVLTIGLFAFLLVFKSIWNLVFALPITFILPMFVGIITGCPRDFWAAGERHELRYKKLVGITLLTSVLVLVFQISFILIFRSLNLDNALAVIWGGVFPSAIIGIPIMISMFKKGRKLFDLDIWKETFTFNAVLIPYYMSITFLNQIDRVMIERFVDAAHAGYYSVAYRAASTINIVTVALNQSLMPWIFKKLKNEKKDDIRKVVSPILICPFLVSLLISLMSPEIIRVLSGTDYLIASGIIPSVAMGMCFRFVSQIFIDIEMYYEKNKTITSTTILVALLNVLLNWIFIPKYGFIAAGYTTLVCFIVQAGIHCFLVLKLSKGNKIFNMSQIWIFCLATTATSFMITIIYNSVLLRYCLLGVAIVIAILFRNRIKRTVAEIRK